jgi:membrane-bound metal-dependent hydrolase YbcI (DUF457 family)
MIAGHFGLAAAVKAQERSTPLWALMLATAWLDVIFVPLFIGHVETMEPAPGATASYGGGIIHADYTHSVVGALALSAILGAIGWRIWDRRVGIVLGLVAFSHWILDLVVHRADLPILPGNALNLPRLGFGLWQLPNVSAIVELLLVLGGAYLYWRAARQTDAAAGRRNRWPDISGAALLVSGLVVLALDFTGIAG